jgi:hypothetical protein
MLSYQTLPPTEGLISMFAKTCRALRLQITGGNERFLHRQTPPLPEKIPPLSPEDELVLISVLMAEINENYAFTLCKYLSLARLGAKPRTCQAGYLQLARATCKGLWVVSKNIKVNTGCTAEIRTRRIILITFLKVVVGT